MLGDNNVDNAMIDVFVLYIDTLNCLRCTFGKQYSAG